MNPSPDVLYLFVLRRVVGVREPVPDARGARQGILQDGVPMTITGHAHMHHVPESTYTNPIGMDL